MAAVGQELHHASDQGFEHSIKRWWLKIRCGAMRRTSISERRASKVSVMSTSANKRRKLLSVLGSSSSDEV